MITQSFLYNAIFFTYALVLGNFYGVSVEHRRRCYLIAFAVGNLAGPLTIGHLFDTIGPQEDDRRHLHPVRRCCWRSPPCCSRPGVLTATTQTVAWCVIFFFASAGASAAYLTVSEIFPLEVRAKAIAVFFAIAQCFGALGPVIYGALIGDGSTPRPAVLRLPARRRRDGGRGPRRRLPRGRRRGQVARGRRHAARGSRAGRRAGAGGTRYTLMREGVAAPRMP